MARYQCVAGAPLLTSLAPAAARVTTPWPRSPCRPPRGSTGTRREGLPEASTARAETPRVCSAGTLAAPTARRIWEAVRERGTGTPVPGASGRATKGVILRSWRSTRFAPYSRSADRCNRLDISPGLRRSVYTSDPVRGMTRGSPRELDRFEQEGAGGYWLPDTHAPRQAPVDFRTAATPDRQ